MKNENRYCNVCREKKADREIVTRGIGAICNDCLQSELDTWIGLYEALTGEEWQQ